MNVFSTPIRRGIAIAMNTILIVSALTAVQVSRPEPAHAREPVTHASSAAQALRLARKQDSEVTVESLTTQSKTVRATPKGEFVATLTSGPMQIQQADDSWAQFNPELRRKGKVWVPAVAGNGVSVGATKLVKTVKVKNKKRKKKPKKKRVVVGTVLSTTTFPASSVSMFAAARTNPKVAATTQLGWPKGITPHKTDPRIRIVWPGKVARPQVQGNVATYKNIRRGVDLHLTSTSAGVVPHFVLTRPVAKKTVLSLPLKLSGLRVSQPARGGYRISDPAGRVVAAGRAMTFATGTTPELPGRSVASVPVRVKKSQLQMTLTPKVFGKPRTAFPLTSAPVAVSPEVTTNGYVWSATPTTSYMTQETINVGKFAKSNSVGRMFAAFDDSAIKGAVVSSASLSMYQVDGSSCTQPRLLVTTPAKSWNSSLTWANQPAATGKYYGFSDTQGHVIGQPDPCAPGFINPGFLSGEVSITPLVKGWADGSIPNNGVEVLSDDENDPASARVITSTRTTAYFQGLSIKVKYTPVPDAPTHPVVSPLTDGFTPTDQPTFSAILPTSCGLEGQTCAGWFRVVDGAGKVAWTSSDIPGAAGQQVEVKVPSSANLANDVPYTMQAFTVVGLGGFSLSRVVSPTSADVSFTVDQIGPDNPTIFTTAYQDGQWKDPAPDNPSFRFTSNGAAAFQVIVDGVSRPNVIVKSGTSASMEWKPPDGWHTMTVWAVDQAGIQSHESATFSFGSGGAGISAPTDQARSAAAFQVAASAPIKSGDLPRQVRALWQQQGDGDAWNELNTGLISHGSEWDRNPDQRGPGLFTPADLIWDTTHTPDVGNGPVLLNLRLCFTFLIDADNPECATQKVQISRHAFGGNFATAPIGPGTVALSTGELQVPASDAALPGSDVTAGRVWLSHFGGQAGLFGPGWHASTPAPAAGAATATVTNNSAQGVIILEQPGGAIDTYVKDGGGGGAGTYRGAGLTAQTSSQIHYTTGSPQKMVLTDTTGDVTTFTSTDGGNSWMGTRVDVAGPHGVTAMSKSDDTYTAVTGVYTDGGGTADCADLSTDDAATTRGCRTMTMNLAPEGTPAPSGDDVGDFAGQVSTITVAQWDTDAKTAGAPVVVAQYAYDAAGMLRHQWNPTQDTSKGPLLNQYEYSSPDPETQPQLVSLTPASAVTGGTAFLAPFTFTYDGLKLTGINRRDPENGKDSPTTISYGVPVAGDDAALPNLSPDRTPDWDQAASEAPQDATAVFYPNPNHDWSVGDSPGGPDSDDWKFSAITYMNEIGATTNSAVFGAGQWLIDTTVYDDQQRVVSTLSAANRVIALSGEQCVTPVAVCARTASMQRARMLQTLTRYDDDLQVPIDTWGPAFDGVTSKTAPGTTETLKTHTQTVYNEGKPSGDGYANITLPTTVKTSAVRATATLDASLAQDIDTKVTKTEYSPVIGGADGWKLRQPTSVTQVMPGAANIVTQTRYNDEGNPTKVVSPGSNGTDAGTTINEYYTGAATSDTASCANRPEWDGAICRSGPANAGDTDAPPVTTTTYSKWLAVATTIDKASNGTTKTVTNTYEPETTKLASVSITSSGGSDQTIAPRTMEYDPDTGGLSITRAGDGSVTSSFDHFGRQVTSTDTTGVVTTTTYDIASRPVTVNDGKGIYTYTYDSETERRGLITRQDTGIGGGRPTEITATYGPEGGPQQVVYPNGVKATFEFNPVGGLTAKSYVAHADDALLAWRQTFNAFGQITTVVGNCSLGQRVQTFGYDNAARLTESADTCSSVTTTRDYTFDVASNRTGLVEKQESMTSEWVNTFDAGSRQLKTTITGSGAGSGTYSYDAFGRTTTLPGIDAVPNTVTTLAYYEDGSTYSQSQGTQSQTFTRDPLGRVDTTITSALGGGNENVTTNHYAGTSDSPTWTQDSGVGTWTRNVTGPGGGLTILETGTAETTTEARLQLTNPHGDVVASIDVVADVDTSELSSVTDYDEYGIILTASAPTPYGWVGSGMRSNANQAGLILMGARMYNPATGRFLTTDSVPGGTPNPYTYPTDPINMYDLAGTWSIGGIINSVVNTVRRAVQWVANKATAAFSAVVRTVTFGRININIPKIKIPKIKLKAISMSPIKMRGLGGGSGGASNTLAMINPTQWTTGPMTIPPNIAGSGTLCAGPCLQGTVTSSGGLVGGAETHGSTQVGCCGLFAGVSLGSTFGAAPQRGDVTFDVNLALLSRVGVSFSEGGFNVNIGAGVGGYAGPMYTFGSW